MLAAIAEFSRPRNFASYSKLEYLDLVVSIEHCHNCASHNVTLRHKAGEYIKNANTFLRSLAQIMHDCNLGARVGVTRFDTHIAPKGSHTDADSRIGAFEIQIAYKNASGNISYELLHSKLATTRWPSRNVVEKRLRAFLSKAGVPTYYKRPDNAGTYTETADGGLGSYPVGMGTFDETPLSDPKWMFPIIPVPLVIQSPTHSHVHSHAPHEDGPPSGLASIQWVFDARDVVVAPQFDVGTTVYVNDVTSKTSKERHPLLGVVKSVPIDPTGSMRVRLKYHTQENVLLEQQLIALSDHIPDDDCITPEKIPLHLCCLLLLAGLMQTGKPLHTVPVIAGRSPIVFRVNESDDQKDADGVVHLGRSSLFHQLRALAASVEAKCADGDNLVTHASFGMPVDMQLSYGESTLNWLQGRFGHVVNTLEMQRVMVEHALVSGAAASPSKRQGRQAVEMKAVTMAAVAAVPTVVAPADAAAAYREKQRAMAAAAATPSVAPEATTIESPAPAPTPEPAPAPVIDASTTPSAEPATAIELSSTEAHVDKGEVGEDIGFTVDADDDGDAHVDHYKDLLFSPARDDAEKWGDAGDEEEGEEGGEEYGQNDFDVEENEAKDD